MSHPNPPADNPLLEETRLPRFSAIEAKHVEPAIDSLLAEGRALVTRTVAQFDGSAGGDQTPTWDTLVAPLEAFDHRLNRIFSPVGHLHSVLDSAEFRESYAAVIPRITEYATEIAQNEGLYHAYQRLRDNRAEFDSLSEAQRTTVDNTLRDFRLAGVSLNPLDKQRFKEVSSALAKLGTEFQQNVLDATQGWRKLVTDEPMLEGLPPSARQLAREAAERNNQAGWRFTLEFPSYLPVMQYARDESLRREVYEAYTTRASDQGPNAGRWDNSRVMAEILRLRHELAQLLGLATYAELSLAKKMAPSPQRVLTFLRDLARRAKPVAQAEYEELAQYARDTDGKTQLEAWDLVYYGEKLRKHKHGLNQEELRPYFPAPKVISGLFAVVHKLFGLRIEPVEGVDRWHSDVSFYRIYDEAGGWRGEFYLDLYARANKRSGAWMDECVVRQVAQGTVVNPVAYLTCNFTPPIGGQPALLTHDEVITLFHEFGHGLHHLLTQVDHAPVAGINGVPWDAVELPSQFLENWCWERSAIDLLAAHYETNEPLPESLFQRLRDAKNFQAGLQTLRQIEFALFDFRLHHGYDAGAYDDAQDPGARFRALLDEVRAEVSVVIPPTFNRFAHAFTHVFGGGYAAGYYSYKWAEVLSSDAFSKFEEQGIFDRDTGRSFMHTVLEQGGTRDAMDLFVAFRGREPTVDALLRHSGLAQTGVAE